MPDEATLLNLIANRPNPIRLEAILAMTGGRPHRKRIEAMLREMADRGLITRVTGNRWSVPAQPTAVSGQFMASLSGGGKVRIPGSEKSHEREIFIPASQTGDAWHKDIVRVLLSPAGEGKGRIIEVLERNLKEIPCVLESSNKKFMYFMPADAHIHARFRVPSAPDRKIAPGDLAILLPLEKAGAHEWNAAIARMCGPAERISAQETIVKINQKAPGPFPELAIEQARALPKEPTETDMANRDDLRHIQFVTIDGADARDFDDAIHVEKTEHGYLLRVAIADVSHYVRPDTRPGSLDDEALKRGNSWYFPTSVEPMLPKELSNGLCSLRPEEDRLAMVVEIPFDKAGNPGEARFTPAVIRSSARLVYEDVEKYFKTGAGVPDKNRAMLDEALGLYRLLAARRRERGTLDFFLPEPKYEFDKDGKLTGMRVAERSDANMLIEEFMIAANEAVARHLEARHAHLLYRVHPRPEAEKLDRLFDTLRRTSVESLPDDLGSFSDPNPEAIQKILAKAAGTPEEFVVNRLCLRSMAQARYQPENIGHFGLASKSYCHFTSPIRRYADLLVHRALKADLGHRDQEIPDKEALAEIGDQLNGLERRAIECEREMAKRLACIALEGKEGEEFSGTISAVTDFGVFVELDNMPVEGLIRMDQLKDDWYQVDQESQRLIGSRTGRVWRLGQPVRVRVASIDLEKQDICLSPVEDKKKRTMHQPKHPARKAPHRKDRARSRRP